jgi:cell division transport system ATP-binding protein
MRMIKFEHVGLRYGIGAEVLKDISFSLEPGSFHFLTGKSGAGKTSLMRLMYLGKRPTRGLISMFGKNVNGQSAAHMTQLRQKIGVVFQDFRLMNHLSTFDNIALPLRIIGRPEKEIKANVEELMEWVDLHDCAKSSPATLSGGQQQRIAIARAIIGKPRLLLADEPTGNLDDSIGAKLMGLFEQLNRMGTTIVIATHSKSILDSFHHPRLVIKDGLLNIETIRSPFSSFEDFSEQESLYNA